MLSPSLALCPQLAQKNVDQRGHRFAFFPLLSCVLSSGSLSLSFYLSSSSLSNLSGALSSGGPL